MHRFVTAFRSGFAAAAPASTLLAATLLTLALAGFARLAAATPSLALPASVHVSPTASPGGLVEVAVEAAPGERIAASLPGLTAGEIDLAYDARTGFHLATLPVPTSSPDKGFCTVRVVFDDRIEHDVQVDLVPRPAEI